MLAEFITLHREEIIRRCVARVAGRSVPAPTPIEIEHGVPLLLDQLVQTLSLGQSTSVEISASALLHGNDLLAQGFTVSQVVHDYGDVCHAITDLAVELNAPIPANDFHMLNGCLDVAIAAAVSEYGRQTAANQADANDAKTRLADERAGYLAHELRDLLHTVMLAFDCVKSGTVGVNGNTSRIIDRAILRASDLVARSLADIKLSTGTQNLEEFPITEFVNEVAETGLLEANARGITLRVARDGGTAEVKADRLILNTAVMNILQNAMKFTRPDTTVVLGVRATTDRVIIEVQDECGGLPNADTLMLFRPFEQHGANRTGLGLGLTFTKKVVEAIHGRVFARNIPGSGCVFTVGLPRVAVPAEAVLKQ